MIKKKDIIKSRIGVAERNAKAQRKQLARHLTSSSFNSIYENSKKDSVR